MNDSPICSNCSEKLFRPPVYTGGEAYCCDGCAIGGPCVCTYDGPAATIDARRILLEAGYAASDIAPVLAECTNCYQRLDGSRVVVDGRPYCCEGCYQGGPCVCTYDRSVDGLDIVSTSPLLDEGLHGMPQAASTPESAGPAGEERPAGKGHLLNFNSLWKQSSRGHAAGPEGGPGPDGGYRAGQGNGLLDDRGDAHRGPQSPPAALAREPEPPAQSSSGDATSAKAPDSAPAAPAREGWAVVQLVVFPLEDIRDVMGVSSALAALPSVLEVTLVRYAGDRATFDVEARAAREVVGDLIESGRVDVETLRRTSGGLELALRPPNGTRS